MNRNNFDLLRPFPTHGFTAKQYLWNAHHWVIQQLHTFDLTWPTQRCWFGAVAKRKILPHRRVLHRTASSAQSHHRIILIHLLMFLTHSFTCWFLSAGQFLSCGFHVHDQFPVQPTHKYLFVTDRRKKAHFVSWLCSLPAERWYEQSVLFDVIFSRWNHNCFNCEYMTCRPLSMNVTRWCTCSCSKADVLMSTPRLASRSLFITIVGTSSEELISHVPRPSVRISHLMFSTLLSRLWKRIAPQNL